MAGSSHSHQITKCWWNFHDRQIPNFSRPATLFSKTIQGLFSFLKFTDFSRLVLNSRPVQEAWSILSGSTVVTQRALLCSLSLHVTPLIMQNTIISVALSSWSMLQNHVSIVVVAYSRTWLVNYILSAHKYLL